MKARFLALLVVVAMALGIGASAYAGSQNTNCIAVGTTATPILTPNSARAFYTLSTTSGSATINFNDDGNTPLSIGGTHSYPLEAGTSYTNSKAPWKGSVLVVSKSGSVWVCAKDGSL